MPMVKASYRRAMRRWVARRQCPSCRGWRDLSVGFAHARRPPTVSCGACGWSGPPADTRPLGRFAQYEMPVLGRKDDDE